MTQQKHSADKPQMFTLYENYMTLQVKKIYDEGSHVPFVARLWIGICNLRDDYLLAIDKDLNEGRKIFDGNYKPVLDSLVTMRVSKRNIDSLIQNHYQKALRGELLKKQNNVIEITESIDIKLMQQFSVFINSGGRVLKSMQPLLKHYDIEIGFLFQKEAQFKEGLAKLEEQDVVLTKYISSVRYSWSEKFLNTRNLLEHHGLVLPEVTYKINGNDITPSEPKIADQNVTDYINKISNHIFSFVEDLIVFSFSKQIPASMKVTELIESQRNPVDPKRFVISHISDVGEPWILKFENTGFY